MRAATHPDLQEQVPVGCGVEFDASTCLTGLPRAPAVQSRARVLSAYP